MEAGNITLYTNLLSQPGRAVKTVLTLGNIAHTEVSIDLAKGENRGEEFLKINPRG